MSEQLVRQLVSLGGLEVRDGGATRGAVTVRMLPETLEEATQALAGKASIRLADMFGDNGGDAWPLHRSAGDGFSKDIGAAVD